MSVGRIARNVGHLLFNPKYQDKITSSIKAAKKLNTMKGVNKYKDLHKHIGDAFVRADKVTSKTSLWKSMKGSITSLPKDMKTSWNGAKGWWNKTKGIGKTLGKRMPVIGAGLMVAFELPNIFSAFKDKGIIGGVLEAGKSAARLGGFMGGMAIGQALIPIPIVGGLIGGILGDWLVSKVVGKSHSEQKQEIVQAQEEQMAQLQAMMQQNPQATLTGNPYATIPQATMTPQQLAYMQQQLYGGGNFMNDDFMANATGMNKLNYTV